VLPIGGFYKARHGGETHAHGATSFTCCSSAVNNDSYTTFKKYSEACGRLPPVSLRHLMNFRPGGEKVAAGRSRIGTEIRKRFVTPGMSLGALSPGSA
jgi:glutamate synthase (NADPH/NADH) large chain